MINPEKKERLEAGKLKAMGISDKRRKSRGRRLRSLVNNEARAYRKSHDR